MTGPPPIPHLPAQTPCYAVNWKIRELRERLDVVLEVWDDPLCWPSVEMVFKEGDWEDTQHWWDPKIFTGWGPKQGIAPNCTLRLQGIWEVGGRGNKSCHGCSSWVKNGTLHRLIPYWEQQEIQRNSTSLPAHSQGIFWKRPLLVVRKLKHCRSDKECSWQLPALLWNI